MRNDKEAIIHISYTMVRIPEGWALPVELSSEQIVTQSLTLPAHPAILGVKTLCPSNTPMEYTQN